MAEGPFFMADTPIHPDHLRMWEKAVYVDENRRTWLPITLKIENNLQVLFRQQDVPLGEPVPPSQLGPHQLPVMWQLYPGLRYRASDSSFWRIVYHVEASVGFPRDPSEYTGASLPVQVPTCRWFSSSDCHSLPASSESSLAKNSPSIPLSSTADLLLKRADSSFLPGVQTHSRNNCSSTFSCCIPTLVTNLSHPTGDHITSGR
ncbi:hypothetical protein JEQ12_008031 [Ovis aries]|uniref:T-cell leukemia/lymphoma protein 1A n=1 Tax=Ovis aries TaxID=9940 RepID=A0A836CWU7_SHEEP|nr:hypothetical protein JEQ12_008031 [Ovis aries]